MANWMTIKGVLNATSSLILGKNGNQIKTKDASTISVRNNSDSSNINLEASQLISTVSTGTAPLSVISSTKNDNLNSDQVDGHDVDDTSTTTGLWSASKIISYSSGLVSPTLDSHSINKNNSDEVQILGFSSASTLQIPYKQSNGNLGWEDLNKSTVSLSNVTNDAQVKKISSSTDNAIIRWDGTTGDLPQDSLITIDDSGSINIPTGQSYKINNTAITTANVADSTDKRYCTDAQKTVIGNTSGTNSGNETTTTIGTLINGASTKSTPIDADIVGFVDTEASNVLKKLTWTNIKAFLKTYFDTLYTLSNLGGVPTSRTVNSKALSSNISLTTSDVGAEPTLTKGNLTESTSSILSITGGTSAVIGSGTTIQVQQANASQSGYLSSTDWNTFNNASSGLSSNYALLNSLGGIGGW